MRFVVPDLWKNFINAKGNNLCNVFRRLALFRRPCLEQLDAAAQFNPRQGRVLPIAVSVSPPPSSKDS